MHLEPRKLIDVTFNLEKPKAYKSNLILLIENMDERDDLKLKDLKTLIARLSERAGKKPYKDDVIDPLHDLIMEKASYGLYTDQELQDVLENPTIFNQYVALEYIFHHKEKETHEKWLMEYKEYLDKNLVELAFGKENIPKAYQDYLDSQTRN